jgi:hypothetical protein
VYRAYAARLVARVPKTASGATTGTAVLGSSDWHVKMSDEDINVICLIIRCGGEMAASESKHKRYLKKTRMNHLAACASAALVAGSSCKEGRAPQRASVGQQGDIM